MNIYEVESAYDEELPNGKSRQVFARAKVKLEDESWVYARLAGSPPSEQWRDLVVKLDKPKLPLTDFPGFDYPSMVCGERVMAAVGDVLRGVGEFLPMTLRGTTGTYQLHHITTRTAGLLDARATTWEDVAGTRSIAALAFNAARIGPKVKLFKIREDHGQTIYCVERTGKATDGEFKALVEKHKLTGLRFKLAWSDGKGPSPRNSPRDARPGVEKSIVESTPSDRPLTSDEERDVRLSVTRGYRHLKLKPGSPAAATQKALRAAVHAVAARRKKPPKQTLADLAVNLGCLWGQTVCDELGWQWCALKIGDDREPIVIATANRSHMVSPMDFVHRQLRHGPEDDTTTAFLFTMIKGKCLGRSKPKSYTQIG